MFEISGRWPQHPDATLHRLRHRDLATTLCVYAHALPLNDEDVADYLADLYGLTDDKAVAPHPTRERLQVRLGR